MKVKNTIYLDYQSTTPTDRAVVDAMLPYFSEEFGNPHSSDHSMGWNASRAVHVAAAHIAKMIGADADEIIFTSGATEANNLALLGLARKNKSIRRRKIFIGAIEHKCVLAAARAIQNESDHEVFTIPVNGEGQVDLDWLTEKVDERTLMVSVMAVNNEIGTISPITNVSEVCHSKGVLLHCDAAQAPYAIETNQLAKYADLISLSAHKMYGPKGIGALYVRREIQNQIEPMIYGGGQQINLRSGTVPAPLAVGFGEAASIYHREWSADCRDEIALMRGEFWGSILKIFPKGVLNGPPLSKRHPGNLNVRFSEWDAHDLLLRLQPGVAASTGAACASGIEEPSHVLKSIGLSDREANSSIRFSLGKFTNKDQLQSAVQAMENLFS